MSVLSNSWRCWLVATALWTMLGSSPAPAAADDQPARTPPGAADREKIEEQVRAMRQKVEQLEKDGKHDEAEKLKREAYEMMSKARAAYGGSTAPQPAASGPEAEKIRGQLKDLSQKIGQLEKEGKHEEAERLKGEAKALYGRLNPRVNATTAPGGPEREKLYQQMRAIHEQIEKAKQEGNPEVVQRLMQEAEALRYRMYAQGGNGSSRPQSGGDRQARLQHLRAAAENLKAAGFEPEAQHVMEMISRIDQAPSGDNMQPWREGRPGYGGAAVPGLPATNSSQYANSPAIQELRGQIEQMHREMRELREQLQQGKSSSNK